MMKLRFISDPGHGWLEVPTHTLHTFALEGWITPYSYISDDGEKTYLEEDCDASRFINAAKDAGVELSIEDVYQERTFIRSLRSFSRGLMA
jgi:DNA-binding transcriptional MerR regulator